MANPAEFQKTQLGFAAHIRNPQTNPRPDDVEARRMKIYNELFYNNVEDFMSSSFPVLREITADDKWHQMIRHYFHNHKAKTPLFPEMPREFLYYLEHERQPAEDDFKFMLELAHYEWAELALSLSEHKHENNSFDTAKGEISEIIPALSSLAWLLHYEFPVHQIGPDFLPENPGEQASYLLMYRDAEDEIHFMELNPVTARLLQFINDKKELNCQQLLTLIVEELNHPDPQLVFNGGLEILGDLFARKVIFPLNQS
ncbi:MAG: putative DNA-binding domain-containing protein [Gammaproteobacteria bacterium]|nr:putative DNA-binding domain-containing protein [Gammaproteobacteria bacterium]MDH5777580.1 putative DNA-binding domain-containing protein [Gammaproteobacteria bacterium]